MACYRDGPVATRARRRECVTAPTPLSADTGARRQSAPFVSDRDHRPG